MVNRPEPKTEWIASGVVVFQSDTAKTYQCPTCGSWVFTTHDGNEDAVIQCELPSGHRVTWLIEH